MPVKVYFNEEIHRFTKLPENLKALTQLITSTFKSELPPAWKLQYTDQDGDLVMLTHEHDYQELLTTESQDSSQDSSLTFKLYIIANQGMISANSQNNREKTAQADHTTMYVDQNRQHTIEVIPQAYPQPQYEGPIILSLTEREDNEDTPFIDGKPIHNCVLCEGCGTNPIVGVRYKCNTCLQFNFCEICEETKDHRHPFLKLKQPYQDKMCEGSESWFGGSHLDEPTEQQIRIFKNLATFKRMAKAYKSGCIKEIHEHRAHLDHEIPELKPMLDRAFQVIAEEGERKKVKQALNEVKDQFMMQFFPEGKWKLFKQWWHWKRVQKEKRREAEINAPKELTEQQIKILSNKATFEEMYHAYNRANTQKMDECRTKIEEEVPDLKPFFDKVWKVIADGGDRKKVKQTIHDMKQDFMIQFFPQGIWKTLKQYKQWKQSCEKKTNPTGDCSYFGWFWGFFKRRSNENMESLLIEKKNQ